MENIVDGAIAPEGVELRALHDYDKLRKQTYEGVKSAVIESFPKSYNGYRMEVADVDYDGPELVGYAEQKEAILQNKFLSRKLRGTVRLVDEKSGDLMDEQRISLMRVPMITDRGSTIHGGNEYFSIMQERLLPGIYTRRQDNGGLETQINPRPTTGRDMRIGFNPETQQYRLKVQTSDLHLYSLLKDLGHDDADIRKRWGDDLFEANAGKYDARVFEKAFQKLVPPPMRKDKPEYSREEKAGMIRHAFDRIEVNRRVAERNMPGMFSPKIATQWAMMHLGRVMANRDMIKLAQSLDFLPDIAPQTIRGDLWWQYEVPHSLVETNTAGPDLLKCSADGFDPDLDSDEMKEPYEATYAGVGPRLAGMKAWPETYYSPESDQMGWIAWYRKFCDGTRTDDDDRQITRWKRFKVREGAKLKKNPTARQGYSLRNWAIDPLKLLDKPEDRERLAEEMLDYKASETEKYLSKKAGFSVPELRAIAQFLNREHSAGLDVSQPAPTLEEDLLAYIMGAGVDSGLLQAGIDGADRAYKEVMEMSKAANEGNPIKQMQLAKQYSDRKQYGAKQAILYGLMKDRPGEFFVDSEDGDIVGITHRPSNFRIHTKKMAVPAEILTRKEEVPPAPRPSEEFEKAASPIPEPLHRDPAWEAPQQAAQATPSKEPATSSPGLVNKSQPNIKYEGHYSPRQFIEPYYGKNYETEVNKAQSYYESKLQNMPTYEKRYAMRAKTWNPFDNENSVPYAQKVPEVKDYGTYRKSVFPQLDYSRLEQPVPVFTTPSHRSFQHPAGVVVSDKSTPPSPQQRAYNLMGPQSVFETPEQRMQTAVEHEMRHQWTASPEFKEFVQGRGSEIELHPKAHPFSYQQGDPVTGIEHEVGDPVIKVDDPDWNSGENVRPLTRTEAQSLKNGPRLTGEEYQDSLSKVDPYRGYRGSNDSAADPLPADLPAYDHGLSIPEQVGWGSGLQQALYQATGKRLETPEEARTFLQRMAVELEPEDFEQEVSGFPNDSARGLRYLRDLHWRSQKFQEDGGLFEGDKGANLYMDWLADLLPGLVGNGQPDEQAIKMGSIQPAFYDQEFNYVQALRPSEEFEKAAQAWDTVHETWNSLQKNAANEDFQQALDSSSLPGDISFYVGGDRVEISMGDWHDAAEAKAAEALAHRYFNVVDVEDESTRPGWATDCLTKSAEEESWAGYEEDYSDPEVETEPVIDYLEAQFQAGEISEEEALQRFRYVTQGTQPTATLQKEAKEVGLQDIRRWTKARKTARLLTQEPKSEAQAEAGNYPKGKFFMRGLEFTIENRKGSTRRGWKPDGSIAWESHMNSDYGYVRKTESERDGDHIDVFIGDDLESDVVYVVDQIDQRTGKFDEHKCMVGYSSMPEAREGYLKCFEKGWTCGKITAITFDQFRDWCFNGDTKKEMSKTRFLIKAAKVEKVIAVDLDGTLAKTVTGPFKSDTIGKPVPKMLARVRRWLKEGRKVVIFTARAADKRNIPHVENWLDDHDLPGLEVTNEKTPNMVRFYDDRAEGVHKDTGEIKGS